MSTRPRRSSSRPAADATPSSSAAPSATVQTPGRSSSGRSSSNTGAAAASQSQRKRRRGTNTDEEGETDVAVPTSTTEEEDTTMQTADTSAPTADSASSTTAGSSKKKKSSSKVSRTASNVSASSAAAADQNDQAAELDVSPVRPPRTVTTPARQSTTQHHVSSPTFDPDTTVQPLLRAKRIEEKNELQELNKRLELYILRQRERDANAGGLNQEIQIMREKFTRESSQSKAHYDARYDELKRQKLDLSTQLQELQDSYAKLAQQTKDTSANSGLYKQRCAELEKRVKKLEEQLVEVSAHAIEYENSSKKYKSDYEAEVASRALLIKQYDTQKETHSHSAKVLNAVQNKLATLQQDYDAAQQAKNEEVGVLTKQLAELRAENQSIEDTLRKEFGAQLKNLLAERQVLADQEREDQVARMKVFYEATLLERNQAFTQQSSALAQAQAEALQATRELEKERKSAASVHNLKADYERHIARLNQEAAEAREKYEYETTTKSTQLQEVQILVQQKEVEFQTLMDVKIALDMEIQQYHALLDNEESRLGLEVPQSILMNSPRSKYAAMAAAKQGRSPQQQKGLFTPSSAATAASSASTQQTPVRRSSSVRGGAATASVQAAFSDLAVSLNPVSQKITLLNNSTSGDSIINLTDCKLVTQNGSECVLPALQLSSGQSLSIVTSGGSAGKNTANNTIIAWNIEPSALWQSGEKLSLKDKKGKVITTVEVRV